MLTRIASAISAAAIGLALVPALAPQAAQAQTATTPAPQRLVQIPRRARRADITFNGTLSVLVDGNAEQLAPGVRIFGPDNMLLLYGNLNGVATSKYIRERGTGMLLTVWILTPDEIAAPDPKLDPNDTDSGTAAQ
jgi:hypothetical protein